MNLDQHYLSLAKTASEKSRCHKKQLGCVLVLSDGTVLEGYNGPPSILPSCNPCPRINSHSGSNQESCRAVHAERLPLLTAARRRMKDTNNSVLYSNMGFPCKNCMVELFEAGVKEIVCTKNTFYDELSKSLLQEWIDKGGIARVVKFE